MQPNGFDERHFVLVFGTLFGHIQVAMFGIGMVHSVELLMSLFNISFFLDSRCHVKNQ